MTVISTARRGWFRAGAVLALAAAMAAFAPGPARSQQYSLDELSRLADNISADFPMVLGGRTIRARFYQKHGFTLADGTRHLMFVFRASNCWLRERSATARAAIDCTGKNGPGVFIPVLFLTPASQSLPGPPWAPDLVLVKGRGTNSLAGYMPRELFDRVPPFAEPRALWVGLTNPELDSLRLTAPAASAALVLCVPFYARECERDGMLTNLDTTPPEPPPAPPRTATASPPPRSRPPAAPAPAAPAAPAPAAPAAPAPAAPAAPVPAAPAAPVPAAPAAPAPAAPAAPPPVPPEMPPSPPAGEVPAQPSAAPRPPPGQLHYVITPAASSTLPGWTSDRLAKRLLALVASSRSQFLVKTPDGTEMPSGTDPELTRSGDAVVAWSGERPEGAAELVFHGVEGLEIVPQTQSSEPQAAPANLVDTRIQTGNFVSFAEFKIATPFLYDQWQARIEAVTKVYGQEQADTVDDLCQFAVLIPRSGWLSFLTGPFSVGLERIDEGGRRILQSQPVIMPAQLMRAAGEPLHLDVQPSDADPACISQTKRLAAFTTATGNATAAWKLSDMPGNPSIGRMEIRPSSLATRGRWLLGLFGPQTVGAATGAEAGSRPADAQKIFNLLATFLDDFRERNFQRGRPESQAIGADLAVIGSADGSATAFSVQNVIIGKFRQPVSPSDQFQLDQEGSRRLSAFLSGAGNSGAEVSFRTVGQTIRHYSQLFGEFSGRKPPIAIYVGAANAMADTCQEWKRMTAEVARLSGRPRLFAIVLANGSADQIGEQLGQNSRGNDEVLTPESRAVTCEGDSGSSLMFVPLPDLVSHSPENVLGPAFSVLERWAGRIQN
jgi:hypothetical protein